MPILDDVTKQVSAVVQGAIKETSGYLGPLTQSKQERRKLTTSEQVERFLSMSDDQLDRVREKLGPEGFQRYSERMIALSRRKYNA